MLSIIDPKLLLSFLIKVCYALVDLVKNLASFSIFFLAGMRYGHSLMMITSEWMANGHHWLLVVPEMLVAVTADSPLR